jgi:hypothetical protein
MDAANLDVAAATVQPTLQTQFELYIPAKALASSPSQFVTTCIQKEL